MNDSQTELPQYLYHYTSQKGLLGILKDMKLWMTNILYLNDSSEFTHTLGLVKSELKKRRNRLVNHFIPLQYKIDKSYEIIENSCTYPKNTGIESYVFSLSTEKDDLNQWRGYCHEGGFCIEFDTNKLSSIIDNNLDVYEIKKCIYDTRRKNKLIKLMLDDIQTLFESNESLEIYHVSERVYLGTIMISSYIKDKSFKDEKEYRIISQGMNFNNEFREGKSMIIPYIEFPHGKDNDKLPISKIIVSPTPHPELSMMSVDSLLKSKGYKEVEVMKSEIPYRSW